MLKIAIPNKGALAEDASQILKDAGYLQRKSDRVLSCFDESNDIQFYYLRPKDIATYVGSGTVDAGITGQDMLANQNVSEDAQPTEVLALNFGNSTFRFAAPAGQVPKNLQALNGKRVATAYPNLVRKFFATNAIEAQSVISLDGAVEVSIELGVADVIADVVSTGATLKAAGLEIFGDPIMTSEAVLIKSKRSGVEAAQFSKLLARINGVLTARAYAIIDYDIPLDKLDAATKLTPGIESPTISETGDPAWRAVRSLVKRDGTNELMDQLSDLGAKGILITRIDASRL